MKASKERSAGFEKLRLGVALGALGLGAGLAGSAARAAVTTTRHHIQGVGAYWGGYTYSGTSCAPPPTGSSSYLGCIGNMTWSFNPAITSSWVSAGSADGYYAISDAATGLWPATDSGQLSDMYDSAFMVAVEGLAFSNPDTAVDYSGTPQTSGQELTTGSMDVNGVSISLRWGFGFGIDKAFRGLYVLSNTTDSTKVVDVAIGGNLGSDSDTTVQMTASGDQAVDAADGWYMSNDNTSVGGEPESDPNFLFGRFGPGAAVTSVPTSVPGIDDGMGYSDNFVETFQLSIAPGETQSILLFAIMSNTLAEGAADAAALADAEALASSGLLDGLDAETLASVQNWGFPDVAAAPSVPVPVMGMVNLLGMGGLVALFGVAAAYRRRGQI